MSFQSRPISVPIQVAGHILNGHKAAVCVGAVGVVAGIVVAFIDFWIAGLIVGVSLPVLVIALVLVRNRIRSRAWVEVFPEGFTYRDRHGETAYTDDQVVGVHVSTRSNYRQGDLKSSTSTIEFKVADRKDPIEMVQTTKVGDFDLLQELLNRTVDNYRERAELALDAGARLGGLGWSLGRDDLDVIEADTTRVALRDLVAIDTVDEEHKIWRRGVDDAILCVPVKSENAFLLSLLLGPKIAEHQQEEFDLSKPGLGRQIFRRQMGPFTRRFAKLGIAFAILAIPLSVACFIVQVPQLMVVGIVLLLTILFVLLLSLFLLRNDFRCHERGVYRRVLGKPRELRYEDVEVFTYGAIRQYYNGAYVGTALSLKFEPAADSGKKKVRYSRMVQNVDSALESLKEHVAQIVMPRMAQLLSTNGDVQWLPHVRLTHEGIHYQPKGLVRRKKEEQLLRFEDVHAFSIEDGTLYVWQRGADKAVISETTNQANFFPGYLLVSALHRAVASQRLVEPGMFD